jgi:hypothetical protein
MEWGIRTTFVVGIKMVCIVNFGFSHHHNKGLKVGLALVRFVHDICMSKVLQKQFFFSIGQP